MNRFPMTVTLSRRSGQTQEFLIKRCIETDLYDFLRLQYKIDQDVSDPGQYALVDEEDILESLKLDQCFGVYVNDALVAFTVMVINRNSLRNYGTYLGYSAEQKRKCVSLEITVVEKEYRGFGLQRYFVRLREELARALGATEALVTIGPENKISLNNLQGEGYEIVDTMPLYGGALRHILRKEL